MSAHLRRLGLDKEKILGSAHPSGILLTQADQEGHAHTIIGAIAVLATQTRDRLPRLSVPKEHKASKRGRDNDHRDNDRQHSLVNRHVAAHPCPIKDLTIDFIGDLDLTIDRAHETGKEEPQLKYGPTILRDAPAIVDVAVKPEQGPALRLRLDDTFNRLKTVIAGIGS